MTTWQLSLALATCSDVCIFKRWRLRSFFAAMSVQPSAPAQSLDAGAVPSGDPENFASGVLNLTILAQDRRACVRLPPSTTLRELYAAAVTALGAAGAPTTPGLRLLYGGRVLPAAGAQTLCDARLFDGVALHALIPVEEVSGEAAASPSTAGATTVPSGSGDVAAQRVDVGVAVQGFDRLAALGLDAAQIGLFRNQFLPDVVADVGPMMPREAGETEAHRVLRMEDAWMRMQGPRTDFAHNIRPLLLSASAARMAALMRAGGAAQPPQLLPPAGAAWRGGGAPAGGDRGGVEDDEEDAEAAEARAAGDWRAPGRAHPDVLALERGTWGAFFAGVVLGSSLGFIMLLWVMQSGWSARFRLGLVLGVAFNIVWSAAVPPVPKTTPKSPPAPGQGGGGGGGGGSDLMPIGPPPGGSIIG